MKEREHRTQNSIKTKKKNDKPKPQSSLYLLVLSLQSEMNTASSVSSLVDEIEKAFLLADYKRSIHLVSDFIRSYLPQKHQYEDTFYHEIQVYSDKPFILVDDEERELRKNGVDESYRVMITSNDEITDTDSVFSIVLQSIYEMYYNSKNKRKKRITTKTESILYQRLIYPFLNCFFVDNKVISLDILKLWLQFSWKTKMFFESNPFSDDKHKCFMLKKNLICTVTELLHRTLLATDFVDSNFHPIIISHTKDLMHLLFIQISPFFSAHKNNTNHMIEGSKDEEIDVSSGIQSHLLAQDCLVNPLYFSWDETVTQLDKSNNQITMCDAYDVAVDLQNFFLSIQSVQKSIESLEHLQKATTDRLASNQQILCTSSPALFVKEFNDFIECILFPQLNQMLDRLKKEKSIKDTSNKKIISSAPAQTRTDSSNIHKTHGNTHKERYISDTSLFNALVNIWKQKRKKKYLSTFFFACTILLFYYSHKRQATKYNKKTRDLFSTISSMFKYLKY